MVVIHSILFIFGKFLVHAGIGVEGNELNAKHSLSDHWGSNLFFDMPQDAKNKFDHQKTNTEGYLFQTPHWFQAWIYTYRHMKIIICKIANSRRELHLIIILMWIYIVVWVFGRINKKFSVLEDYTPQSNLERAWLGVCWGLHIIKSKKRDYAICM